MDTIIGLSGTIFMLVLLSFGVPISFALGFTGLVGFAVLWGTSAAISLSIITAYIKTASFLLACIPLFVLMGQTVFHCGIAKELFSALQIWLSRLPGGLAMAITTASAGFASVSGSSSATAATMGSVALPELKRYNYSPQLATGCLAAAGTLGILIPPSVPMVIYGIMTEQSIGKLFIAGIIPGLISAGLYMTMIYLRAKRNPTLAPAGPAFCWKERMRSVRSIWPVVLIFLIVVGGIYFGIFTPTEAAAVGATVALLVALGKRKLNKEALKASMAETTQLSGMILAVVIGSMVFASFIITTGVPNALASIVESLDVNRYVILVVMLLIYLLIGCIMTVIEILVVTIPLFFPIVLKLGFDPIWFGIILTKMIEISLITPPIGINCLIIKGVGGEYASTIDVFKGVTWFFIMDIVTLIILIIFPQISLYLPSIMYQ
ncbi:MAG: TRAP transporter large permease [Deltaproteobacteria bacterium]|nr:MAG: TRAP transporter large permease [Deltaproteobacteria bacterium]